MVNMTVTRGDTFVFGFELVGVDRITTAFFTLKANKTDINPVRQVFLYEGIDYVEAGKYRVRLSPEQTAGLDVKPYYYDLQIGVNGDKFTILSGQLDILQNIA